MALRVKSLNAFKRMAAGGKGPRRKSLGPSESDLSKDTALFFDDALPVGALFTHIASGGYRHPKIARQMKDEGVRKGAPDFIIVTPCSKMFRMCGWVTIFIEEKIEGGELEEDQIKWAARLQAAGQPWFLCRTVEEVETALRACGVALRARPRRFHTLHAHSTAQGQGARHE
jgi:hypothetical protein